MRILWMTAVTIFIVLFFARAVLFMIVDGIRRDGERRRAKLRSPYRMVDPGVYP